MERKNPWEALAADMSRAMNGLTSSIKWSGANSRRMSRCIREGASRVNLGQVVTDGLRSALALVWSVQQQQINAV